MNQKLQSKNLLNEPNNLDIFDDSELQDIIDPEPIIDIDMDGLDEKSQIEAQEIIGSLSKLYYDEDFIRRQPAFKKRVDAEIESLRINLKMRKSDEIAHDMCLKKICQNSENASMYKALTDIQRTIVSITSKIEDSLTKLSNMMKSYQTELNFDESDEEQVEEYQEIGKSFKGSKSFIESVGSDLDDIIIPEDDDD